MAGPSRIGAVALVTFLSCLVLGGVWGLVIYVLPQSDALPEAGSMSIPPASAPSPSATSLPRQTLQDASPQPVPVQAEAPVVQLESSPQLMAEAVPVPLGWAVKCDLEIEALCPEEEGERQACLQRKAAQLSVPCRPMLRETLVRMKETRQQLRAACEADRRRFCRDVPLGGGAMLQCLESHAQEVSDQCFQFLPKRGRLLN